MQGMLIVLDMFDVIFVIGWTECKNKEYINTSSHIWA